MRLLYTFHDDRNAKTFSSFLLQNGIQNQLDIYKNTDWGSPHYGDITCRVWIIDEDDVAAAHQHLETFLENPNDKKFIYLRPSLSNANLQEESEISPKEQLPIPKLKIRPNAKREWSGGIVTFYLIALCTLVFIVSLMTRPSPEPFPQKLSPTPLFSSKIEKLFYFDYPHAYEIIDKVVSAYGLEKVLNPQTLPSEGRYLLQQYFQTPYWEGLYKKMVLSIRGSEKPLTWEAPLFEKLKQGEIWRLFTPCLLHADLFHLFFNMVWLLVMGRQMEQKLGVFRYLFFIVLTGIFSNIAQYIMSGSNFIGISGVLCAMIAFVWIRQKKAPWEGYHLHPSTIKFIAAFILVLAGLQGIIFFLEIAGQTGLSLPIANTAHLAGAFAGYLLAQTRFFAWKV
jgi:GlpG protein